MVKYGNSIFLFKRSYTGQYFVELPLRIFQMVTKWYIMVTCKPINKKIRQI